MDAQGLIYDWNSQGAEFDWRQARVDLNDETLRDGLQCPSVKDPKVEQKVRLLHLMADLGIVAADIGLPGDLQIGTYTVETMVVRSGKVVGRTVEKFNVRLSGIERWIWNAAHDYPWLFGGLFTLAAMLLGIVLTAIPYRPR